MKKEVLMAITIGFGLGLVITFGIWVANRSLKNAGTVKPQVAGETVTPTSPTPAPTPTDSVLTISSPVNEALVTDSNLKLNGSTTPGNTVVILHENGQELAKVDPDGSFAISLKLLGGYNNITITSISPTGIQTSKTLTVTYTTAKL